MTLTTTFAARMRATRWERPVFIGFGLFGLFVTAYGLATTHILGPELWPRPALWRLGGLAAAVILAGVVVRLFAARQTMAWAAVLLSACAIVGFGIGPFAAVMLIFAACLCLGDLILGRCARELQPAQAASLATATGFALLILGASLAMFFPINTATFYVLVLMAMVLANTSALKIHVFDPLRRIDPLAYPRFGSATFWLGVILVIVILVHAVQAALPERYNDALAFHLLVPSTIEAKGYWPFDVNTYIWAVMPMGGDWAFTIAYLLAGENAIKLLNLSAFLLIMWMLYALLVPRVGRVSTLICLLLLATTPVVVLVSASAFIEHQLALFQLAAFIALVHFRARMGLRETTIVILLAAAAATTKLHGSIIAGLAGFVVLVLIYRQHQPRTLWPYALVILSITAVGLLPYENAYYATGNPFFPFFNSVLPSAIPATENFAQSYPGGLPWNMLYRMSFNSSAYLESGNGIFGFQFIAIGFLGAAVTLASRNRVAMLALLFGLTYIAGVSLNTQYIRYLYAAFPFLIIVCAESFATARTLGRWYQRVLLGGGIGIAALNFALIPAAGSILAGFRLDAVFSQTARSAMQEAITPQRGMISIVNALAGPSARLAVFGAPFVAGLQGTAVFSNWYNFALQKRILSVHYLEPNSEEEVRQFFLEYRVTHVMITATEGDFTRPYLKDFIPRYGRLIAKKGDVALYEMNPDFIYVTDLIKNGDFSDGMTSWLPDQPSTFERTSTGSLQLSPHAILRQNLQIPLKGGETLRYKADVTCPASIHAKDVQVVHVFALQLNWAAPEGKYLGYSMEQPACFAPGRTILDGVLKVPENAVGAQFIVSAIGTQPLEIIKLSLSRREFQP